MALRSSLRAPDRIEIDRYRLACDLKHMGVGDAIGLRFVFACF